jgi:hypothetical protein
MQQHWLIIERVENWEADRKMDFHFLVYLPANAIAILDQVHRSFQRGCVPRVINLSSLRIVAQALGACPGARDLLSPGPGGNEPGCPVPPASLSLAPLGCWRRGLARRAVTPCWGAGVILVSTATKGSRSGKRSSPTLISKKAQPRDKARQNHDRMGFYSVYLPVHRVLPKPLHHRHELRVRYTSAAMYQIPEHISALMWAFTSASHREIRTQARRW